MTKTFTNVDLSTDPEAHSYIKDETVSVTFATSDGEVGSREGANRYTAGDALITGSTGDRWSVSRKRFDAKYTPVPPLMHGSNGSYRNKPMPVYAKQIHEPFAIARSAGGDLIRGNAGDWLMQYAPHDHGIVADSKFRKVYRRVEVESRSDWR